MTPDLKQQLINILNHNDIDCEPDCTCGFTEIIELLETNIECIIVEFTNQKNKEEKV